MKKFIFGIFIGGLVFGTITGVVAFNYNAKDIGYTPSDNTWNVNNVEDALKDLHTNTKKELNNPDKILDSIDGAIVDDDYSLCMLAVARAANGNSITLNNTDVTPLFHKYYAGGGAALTFHMFKDLKKNDSVGYISNGTLFCWK